LDHCLATEQTFGQRILMATPGFLESTPEEEEEVGSVTRTLAPLDSRTACFSCFLRFHGYF
jgi:hypothetical protein